MDTKRVKKYVVFGVIVIVIFFLGVAVAANQCSDKKVLALDTVIADLDCSEQNEAVIRKVYRGKVSECDRATIAGVCRSNSGESDLTEENSLRLELNNTTVKEKR